MHFGAQGIYMGTRFIVTKECEFNQKVKEAIIEAKEKFPKVTATLVTQGYFCMHAKRLVARAAIIIEIKEQTKEAKAENETVPDHLSGEDY